MTPLLLFVKRHGYDQIVAGTKTATIRPWKQTTLRRGDTLSFNGRLHCRITRVVRATVATLTAADALAAGFPSPAACRRTLRALYPTLTPASPCVVLHFRAPK